MRIRVFISGVFALLVLPNYGHAQSLAGLLQSSQCPSPVYFPVETYYAGRISLEHNRVRIQVNDLGTIPARDDFLKRSHAQKNEIFPKMDTIHEFTTGGEADFGSLPSDVYKGLEKSGGRYFFKVRGSGEELKKVKVLHRSIPPHGQVVIQEVSVPDYFSRIRKNAIEPVLQRCRK
jgi:hypothetical protein